MTAPYDFTFFENEIFPKWLRLLQTKDKTGEYGRKFGKSTNLYGTTDVLISRYIVNQLNINSEEKKLWADVINRYQDPTTGWYRAIFPLHYKEHTTAYAVAALHLIQETPQYSLKFLDPILHSEQSMVRWATHFNWSAIWPGSHVISGIPACLAMTKGKNHPFFEWYFDWLNREVDPQSGFWLRGWIHHSGMRKVPTYKEMAGAFHMYYIYEYFNRKWLYPEKIIDFTLDFQHQNGLWDKDVTYCVDLDGIYCLTRSLKLTHGYRESEIRLAVERYLQTAEKILNNPDFFFKHYQNSHTLPGALAAIAEGQKWYPDMVKTLRPWKQSLDDACFI